MCVCVCVCLCVCVLNNMLFVCRGLNPNAFLKEGFAKASITCPYSNYNVAVVAFVNISF